MVCFASVRLWNRLVDPLDGSVAVVYCFVTPCQARADAAMKFIQHVFEGLNISYHTAGNGRLRRSPSSGIVWPGCYPASPAFSGQVSGCQMEQVCPR